MREAVMDRDVAAETVEWLRPLLEQREEPFMAGLRVANQQPPSTLDPASMPVLVIASTGTSGEWPHTQEDTLTFTVWHRSRDEAIDAARLTHAIALREEGGPLEQIQTINRTTHTRDSAGADLGSFTLLAALTPGSFTPAPPA